MKESDIKFVVGHFDATAFNRRKAWSRVISHTLPWWRRMSVAAASAAIILAAAAATAYYFSVGGSVSRQSDEPESSQMVENRAIHRFEFDHKPISEAAAEIEDAYGVKLNNLPEGDIEITLTFEGTVDDLISLVNESLGSEISVEP